MPNENAGILDIKCEGSTWKCGAFESKSEDFHTHARALNRNHQILKKHMLLFYKNARRFYEQIKDFENKCQDLATKCKGNGVHMHAVRIWQLIWKAQNIKKYQTKLQPTTNVIFEKTKISTQKACQTPYQPHSGRYVNRIWNTIESKSVFHVSGKNKNSDAPR